MSQKRLVSISKVTWVLFCIVKSIDSLNLWNVTEATTPHKLHIYAFLQWDLYNLNLLHIFIKYEIKYLSLIFH